MNIFLGVEGGGSVTEFVLIDETGQLRRATGRAVPTI